MKLSYKPLFRIRLRHTFYREGESRSDFKVRPTAETQRVLDQRGLLFKTDPDTFTVAAEVDPERDPPTLMRPIGAENLCLRFQLEPQHDYLFNISQLAPYRMGRELFCFDNLYDEQADGRRYVGDSVSATRLGDPVSLQSSWTVDYQFAAPVASAQLTLSDRFGNPLNTLLAQAPPGEAPLQGWRYDLSEIDGIKPGRYRIEDDHGGELAFYFDPARFGGNCFGIIEIFNRTDTLTPDHADRVPAACRFLDGDALTGTADFSLQLERRSTRWRYFVNKKYDNNSITLALLSLTGPVAFDREDEPKRVVFTAQDPLPLAEIRQVVTLAHDGTEICRLPNPSPTSPLEGSAEEGIQYSDIYVYV